MVPALPTRLATIYLLSFFALVSSAANRDILRPGTSLTVEAYQSEILQSPDGTFSCGFYGVYDNAFTFSIWYSKAANRTVVWSANRHRPVHSRRSALTLHKDGNMVLTDYDDSVVWQADHDGNYHRNIQHAQLLDTGNLVMKNTSGATIWQSFDSPTDTLLPAQYITATTKLVSTTQSHAPGNYIFRFNDISLLSLIYDVPEVSDIYWPNPDNSVYDNNRSRYNSTRLAILDNNGVLASSDFADGVLLKASDAASGTKRRLTLDPDGSGSEVHSKLQKLVRVLADKLGGLEESSINEFVDPELGGQFSYVQARTMIKLAVSCLQEDRNKRPTMESVVQTLLPFDEASG
ncbi:hypothetical protein ZWY2020_040121 [Hordeum vulgare]|nr:hypothetical protein ZWY2020_040121 [Hordeum vulgare]